MRKDVVPEIRKQVEEQIVGSDKFNVRVVGQGLINLSIPPNTAAIVSEHPKIDITAPHWEVVDRCRFELGLSPP